MGAASHAQGIAPPHAELSGVASPCQTPRMTAAPRSRMLRRRLAAHLPLAVVALLLAGWGGCSGMQDMFPNPTFGTRRHVHEDRGPLIAGTACAGASSPCPWALTADGAGLVLAQWYVFHLRVADGAREELGILPVVDRFLVAQDGSALFALTPGDASSPFALHEVFQGTTYALEAGLDLWKGIALSPAGDAVMYWRRSEVGDARLRRLAEPTVTELPCSWTPVAFSPTLDEVACQSMSAQITGPFVRVRTADGAITRLAHEAYGNAMSGVLWTEAGLRIAGHRDGQYAVFDEATGGWTGFGTPNENTGGGSFALVRGGSAVVFAESECLSDPDRAVHNGCDWYEGRVRVADLAAGRAWTVASGEIGPAGFAFQLSADGRSVAYAFGDGIHLRATGL